MDTSGRTGRRDIGRKIAIPFLTLLFLFNVLAGWTKVQVLWPLSALKIIAMANRAMVLLFFALLIVLYSLREPAVSICKSFTARAIALIATFLPLTTLFFIKPIFCPPAVVVVAASITTGLGMFCVLMSLGAFGRNFSIMPQTRYFVRKGPYLLVRHPITWASYWLFWG